MGGHHAGSGAHVRERAMMPRDGTRGRRRTARRGAITARALASLVTLGCGREEADLLMPGFEAGAPPVRDAPVLIDVALAPDGDATISVPDVVTPQDVASCIRGHAAQFMGTSSLSVARPVE